MNPVQRILVLLQHVDEANWALERALTLATRAGAEIEVRLCQTDTALRLEAFLDAERGQRAIDTYLRGLQLQLDELLAAYPFAGRLRSATAVWAESLHTAMVREVLKCQPQLVIKQSRYHPVLERLLFTPVDWQLLHECPAPLLLVREGPQAIGPVIGAVDPHPDRQESPDLNDQVLFAGDYLSGLLERPLHLVQVFEAPPVMLAAEGEASLVDYNEYYQYAEQYHRQVLQDFLHRHQRPLSQAELLEGSVEQVLAAEVSKRQASVLVLGARAEELFLGHTAERILENLSCDVLAVKSDSFRCPIQL